MTLAVILGACIGLCLGVFGGGGSVVTVPALVYVLHQSPSNAVTQSLVIVGFSSGVAAVVHSRRGHVRWGTGLVLGATGAGGAWLGTSLGKLVTPDVVMASFAGLMLIVAAVLLINSRNRRRGDKAILLPEAQAPLSVGNVDPTNKAVTATWDRPAFKVVLAGIGIGLLTGFFGVGGGFIIVPALAIILGYSMPVAIGTSLLVITINAAMALAARGPVIVVDWHVVLPVLIAATIGSISGKFLIRHIPERSLTSGFAALLVVIAAYSAARSMGFISA